MKKVLALVLAAALSVSVFAGCGGSGKSGSKLDQIKKSGEIVMYTNAEFPPYEYLGDDNNVAGVDVEIGQAIADSLGVKLKVQNTNFEGIVAGIASGKGDLGLSGITITAERKKEVDFSVPYVESVQYLVIPEDSDIETMEDLAGKTCGGQTGTTGFMLVDDEINGTNGAAGVLKGKDATAKAYNSAPTAMLDLQAGRIQAVVIDELVAIELAKANPGYKAIPFKYEDGNPVAEQFAVAVKKGNDDLLEAVNKVVQDLVDNGKIQEFIDKHADSTGDAE